MTMSEAPISITVKSPAGSLVTIRANNAEELDNSVANGLASIASAVQELENIIKTNPIANVAYMQNALNATVVDSTVPKVQINVPSFNPVQITTCPHGNMTAIQGTGKDGKMYKGYFCPAPIGDPTKCKNKYATIGTPEWNMFNPDKIK